MRVVELGGEFARFDDVSHSGSELTAFRVLSVNVH